MKLQDYIQYYLGCECTTSLNGYMATLLGVDRHYDMPLKITQEIGIFHVKYEEVKPILRRLEEISGMELRDIYRLIFKREFPATGNIVFRKDTSLSSDPRWVLSTGCDRVGVEVSGHVWADCDLHHYKFNQHEVTRLLLNKRFDLFGLIDAGLAIDKATIKA